MFIDFPYDRALSEDVAADAEHWIVREGRVGELGSVADILADSFHPPGGIARWVYPLLRLGIYEDLRHRLRSTSPNRIFLIAVAPALSRTRLECLVGTVEITLRSSFSWQHPTTQYAYIANLAVSQSYRRRGVAQRLLLSCERIAREWGFRDVYLHVLENNHEARQLYLKTGYQLEQIDTTWSSWLLKQPRRLFLHKHLI